VKGTAFLGSFRDGFLRLSGRVRRRLKGIRGPQPQLELLAHGERGF